MNQKTKLILQLFTFVVSASTNSMINGQTLYQPGVTTARGFECGVLSHNVLDDPRVLTSFVAGIFIKQQDFREPYKFWLSGTIIGPTSVLTIWGGAYASSLRNRGDSKYKIPRPENFFIAAGLNSTDIFVSDQYMQIRNVEYIIPHADENPNNLAFHLVIFHTKKPFDFTSPFVKPICLPPTIILPEQDSHAIVGFEFSPNPVKYSRTQLFALYPQIYCTTAYWYYYKANASHILCAKPLKDFHEDFCVTHGSGLTFLIQGKYFLGGVVALIPSKRGNVCKDNSLYFFSSFTSAEETDQIEWLNHNLDPKGFPCKGGPCVPLSKVCDYAVDCPGGDDESPMFCSAATYCDNEKAIPCGLKDDCVEPSQLCNNVVDCKNGADESAFFCSSENSTTAPTKNPDILTSDKLLYSEVFGVDPPSVSGTTKMAKKCENLQTINGVKSVCRLNKEITSCDNAVIGTNITLSCKPFYQPKFRHSSVTMTCGEDGRWKPFRSFGCEAECGRVDFLGGNITPFIANGQDTVAEIFPWYAAIFSLNETTGQFEFSCGATLIENQVIVTAAHCFRRQGDAELQLRKYRVVLGAESSEMGKNQEMNGALITGITGYWTPPTFDTYTLTSDIALARLSTPVTYSSRIRPICYLLKNDFPLPPPGTLGVLSGFGKDEDGLIPSTLKWANFPVVEKAECEKLLGLQISANEFCAGFFNGTAACEGDSGGGIVFRRRSRDFSSPLVLKGIVSRGTLTKDGKCDTNNLAVFTLIDAFSDWMLDVLEAMEVS